MNVEIITIGSELLQGYLIDTNSAWMSEQLAEVGIDTYFQSKVGDNIDRITLIMQQALERADIVICCGGLGPTQDDLTKNALAAILNVPLIKDEAIAQKIIEKFALRQRPMPENNLNQAYRPQGSNVLNAFPGTAPGLHCITQKNKHIFAVPGVPSEMKMMFTQDILPILLKMQGSNATLYSITLKVAGMGESEIAEKLHEINQELEAKTQPKLSFLASGMNGIKVRLTAKAENKALAQHLIEPYETKIRNLLGQAIFGTENDSLESALLALLDSHHLTLSIFETLSAGLIQYRLSEETLAEKIIKGGQIQYIPSNQRNNSIDEQKQMAQDYAKQIRAQSKSDIGIAIYAHKPEQKKLTPILIAIATQDTCITKEYLPPIEIKKIKEFLVFYALNELRLFLLRK